MAEGKFSSQTFLQAIRSQTISEGREIELRQPASLTSGAINVICGKNHVGKTFILKQVAELCKRSSSTATASAGPFSIFKSQPQNIRLLRANLFEMKNKFGRMKVGDATRENYLADRAFYLALTRIVWSALNGGLPGRSRSESKRHNYDKFPGLIMGNAGGFRRKILEQVPTTQPVYPEHLFFRAISDFLGAEIGVVRIDSNVELAFRDGREFCPFSEWSDGLKALGCLEAVLHVREHDILLIDELENHLHPTFITAALNSIKASGIQAIITSHHPHLIFSNWVDEVIYLERQSAEGRRPNRYRITATNLETDFEKISKAYSLFSDRDNTLMRQAAFTRDSADVDFFNAFVGSFAFEVVEEKRGGAKLDGQTQGLIQVLSPSILNKPMLKIIDIGAGRGRTFF